MNALQGRLGPGILIHLLQYLALHGAAGRLSVHADGQPVGEIYLARGRVTHADLGTLPGMPALARMTAWEQGRFAFQVGVVAPGANVDLPVERVLLSLAIERDAGRAAAELAAGRNGPLTATPLAEPGVLPGLRWAAVAVAGPIGEVFVEEALDTIGYGALWLPEDQLGVLVHEVAGRFRTARVREEFLTRADAVLAHHGYGRAEVEG